MGIVRESFLMNKMRLGEKTLLELINDHQTKVHEDIRKKISVFQTKILDEIETFRSAIARIEKYSESRKEVERQLDLQYQRKVSEALDAHLSRESTLILEKQRLEKLEELEALNQTLKSRTTEDFSIFEKNIARLITQILGTKDNVRAKSNEIVRILKDPRCPVSIGIATFAKRIVAASQNPFACSHVIVYVTSKFPQAMDIILAKFHRACIYTVPIVNLELKNEAYYQRVDSVMRLYGALVQTDVRGATNIHGIEHGWAWFAQFLDNKISANRATATALRAFLETAGFCLHQRYKSHFLKVVNVIRKSFLPKLTGRMDSPELRLIKAYLDDLMYLKEPEGRTMKTNLLSTQFIAELQFQGLLEVQGTLISNYI